MNELSHIERLVRGTKDRASRAKQPQIQPGMPRMSRNLSERAQPVWREIIRLLKERGTLTKGDGPTIAAYAECQARLWAVQELIVSEGMVLSGGKTHPCMAVVENCERMLRNYLRDFGLVGLTRERVLPTASAEEPEGTSRALTLLMKGKKSAARNLPTQ